MGWLNPASTASPPRVAPTELRPPSPDQVQRLLGHVGEHDPDFTTYLWLAASTGARRSQLLRLRSAEIDARHAAIGFARAYVEGPTGPVLRPTKSHRTYRVAIDDATIQRLIEHRRRAEVRAEANKVELADHGSCSPPRPTVRGRGCLPGYPNVHPARAPCRGGPLSAARPAALYGHPDARHGVAVATVSQRLGDARASTTLDVYSHICIPGADRDAADSIFKTQPRSRASATAMALRLSSGGHWAHRTPNGYGRPNPARLRVAWYRTRRRSSGSPAFQGSTSRRSVYR